MTGRLTLSCRVSEQKLDGIAKDIEGIKLLLQSPTVPEVEDKSSSDPDQHFQRDDSFASALKRQPAACGREEPVWDHPPQMIGFVKAIVKDLDSRDVGFDTDRVLPLLRSVAGVLERPILSADLSLSTCKFLERQPPPLLCPSNAVLAVLRWAKGLFKPPKNVSHC